LKVSETFSELAPPLILKKEMSNLSDAKPAVSDEDMKAADTDEEDHLYWKVYGAGIVFVIISLTQFQGCLFYTCQVALSLYIYMYISTCSPFSCVRDSASLRLARACTPLTFCHHVSAWRFQFWRQAEGKKQPQGWNISGHLQ
jgi:hypothetical protein